MAIDVCVDGCRRRCRWQSVVVPQRTSDNNMKTDKEDYLVGIIIFLFFIFILFYFLLNFTEGQYENVQS